MSFLNPIYLLGLTSIFIPILIHFWNRKQSPPIKVGSIKRFESDSKEQAKKFHFKNLPLLISRIILLALFSLVAAELFYPKNEIINKEIDKVLLIDYELKGKEVLPKLIQKIDSTNRTIYFTDSLSKQNYWTELNAILGLQFIPDTVQFIGYNQLKNFTGKKKEFPFYIDWILIPKETERAFSLQNSQNNLLANSSETNIHYVQGQAQALENNFRLKDTLKILNLTKKNHPAFYKVKSAIEILQKQSPFQLVLVSSEEIHSSKTRTFDLLLSSDKIDQSAESFKFSKELHFHQSEIHLTSQIEKKNSQTIVHSDFTKKDPDLIYKIGQLIYQNKELENFISNNDNRIVSSKLLANKKILQKTKPTELTRTKKISLHNPLWILIALSLFVERFLAFKSVKP